MHAVVIKGRPCKVVDISKAKVGKHGAAKCHFVGIDIFTTKKYESICPASAQLSEPLVDRQEYQVFVRDRNRNRSTPLYNIMPFSLSNYSASARLQHIRGAL